MYLCIILYNLIFYAYRSASPFLAPKGVFNLENHSVSHSLTYSHLAFIPMPEYCSNLKALIPILVDTLGSIYFNVSIGQACIIIWHLVPTLLYRDLWKSDPFI